MNEFVNYYNKGTYIAICHEYMSISLELEEIIGLDVFKEDFDFEANMSVRIQLFAKHYDDGLKIIFRLNKYLVTDTDDDILFLENASRIVLRRTGNKIYPLKREKASKDYPFYLLEEQIYFI